MSSIKDVLLALTTVMLFSRLLLGVRLSCKEYVPATSDWKLPMHSDIIVLEMLQLNDDSFPRLFEKILGDFSSADAHKGKFRTLIA